MKSQENPYLYSVILPHDSWENPPLITHNSQLKKMFDIRPYAKAELASLYSPNIAPRSAVKTLVRWINGCPMLVEELRAFNYQPHRHSFLKPEVVAIVKHLGES